jgi:hypothetical protein
VGAQILKKPPTDDVSGFCLCQGSLQAEKVNPLRYYIDPEAIKTSTEGFESIYQKKCPMVKQNFLFQN